MIKEQFPVTRNIRLALSVGVVLATMSLYAEGVLKNGLIEIVLLIPLAWYWLRPSSGAWLSSALVSYIAACFTLSAVDILLRPIYGPLVHATPLNIASRKLPQLPIVGRWDPYLSLKMESYGDLAAMAGDLSFREPRRVVFRTDGAGFRNERESGPFDVVVLGDSFPAGGGTTQDRVYSSLLEQHYGLRTYNLSYPGGPYDQYVNFAIEGPRLSLAPNAHLVWSFFTGNDLDDAEGQEWELTVYRGVAD